MFVDIYENGVRLVVDQLSDGRLALRALTADKTELDELPDHFALQRNYSLVNIHLNGHDQQGHHFAKYIDGNSSEKSEVPVYRTHRDQHNHFGRRLEFVQYTDNLEIISVFQFFDGLTIVRCHTELFNRGSEPVGVEAVASLCLTGLMADQTRDRSQIHATIIRGGWAAELQPDTRNLKDWGLNGFNSLGVLQKRLAVSNCGSFAAKEFFPIGLLENRLAKIGYVWQIESCSGWHWEISEAANRRIYLYLSGPNEREHHWFKELKPGERFQSASCALAPVKGEIQCGLQTFNEYRRRLKLFSSRKLDLIFNDYMHCLWADPSTEKELPLIKRAAEAGAEVYMIDAGWYGKGYWWDTVGLWQEEATRFPNGLREVTDAIRHHKMIPGIWLEIERMGKNCPLASQWPDECFFRRHNRRVIENGSLQLDFRHPQVRNHATEVIERLSRDLGVQAFKLDYNIEIGTGTEVHSDSFGDGLLGHQEAYLQWFDQIRNRHPDWLFENCASGGLRNTQPYLSRVQICSLSDNTDYLDLARIAINAPLAIPPEQCGVWVLARRDADMRELSFNLVTALMQRPTFSGDIIRLSTEAMNLLQQAAELYKTGLRDFIGLAEPWWPLGLVRCSDAWGALGLQDSQQILLGVWHFSNDESTLQIPLDKFTRPHIKTLFPSIPDHLQWKFQSGKLCISIPAKSAVLFKIVPE